MSATVTLRCDGCGGSFEEPWRKIASRPLAEFAGAVEHKSHWVPESIREQIRAVARARSNADRAQSRRERASP